MSRKGFLAFTIFAVLPWLTKTEWSLAKSAHWIMAVVLVRVTCSSTNQSVFFGVQESR